MSETVKTNERWYKSENRLFHADTVTNKSTGEVVEISNSLEKLYTYMLNQYRFRSGLKQPFAESQERLGRIARIGDARKNTKPQIDKLIALGLVEITGKMGRCNIYKVVEVDKVAGNLEFTYIEHSGEPTYNHEKRLGKSSLQPEIEESEDGTQQQNHERQTPDVSPTASEPVQQADGVASASATNDPEQQSGVSQPAGDSGDAISGDDAVNGGNVIQFPTVKRPDQSQMADIDTLNNWAEGYDGEGFMAYGAMWGITKPGAIADLIKSHIRKIQSDGYKGSRSVANDELPRADAIYKQQQAQRAAAAKQGANAQPTQAWDENQPF
ncbi:DUF6945 domain-containing protein [Enterobacter mori]